MILCYKESLFLFLGTYSLAEYDNDDDDNKQTKKIREKIILELLSLKELGKRGCKIHPIQR